MAVNSPAAPKTVDTALVKKKTENLAQALQKRGAQDGAKRLMVVAKQMQYLTVEGAFQYIRRDEIIEELGNQPRKFLNFLHRSRDILSITPIIITWIALGLAAFAYQNDLADTRHYPNDLYQPFLLLWQEGFHGRIPPFADAAILDAIVLFLLVALIIVIPGQERRNQNKLHDTLKDLDFDTVIDDLLAAIGQNGVNAHLADSDVKKISQAIEQTLQKVLLNYDRVAGEAREFVKNTNQSTQSLVKNFEDNLVVFNGDVKLLTHDLQTLDNNLDSYGQKLTELTDASNKLVGSSSDLALNAKRMADSADQSSQASQGISTQLGTLNTAQQEIIKTQQQVANTITQTQHDLAKQSATAQQHIADTITQSQKQVADTITQTQGEVVKQFATTQTNVVQKIESTQDTVAKDIAVVADTMGESARDTRDVAKELERVIQGLKQMTQADFQSMTTQVSNAATQVNRVATSLGQIDQQLQTTTQALNNASNSLNANASGKSPKSLSSKIAYTACSVAIAIVIGELFELILRIH